MSKKEAGKIQVENLVLKVSVDVNGETRTYSLGSDGLYFRMLCSNFEIEPEAALLKDYAALARALSKYLCALLEELKEKSKKRCSCCGQEIKED